MHRANNAEVGFSAFGFCEIRNIAKRQFHRFAFRTAIENSINDFTKILAFDDNQIIAQGRHFHVAIGQCQMRITEIDQLRNPCAQFSFLF